MKEKTYKYVNVTEIIGVCTNISNFRWGFGKCDLPVTDDAFEKCKIKVYLNKTKDDEVFSGLDVSSYTNSFRDFRIKPQAKTLIFDKKIKGIVKLRYVISVKNNNVYVSVGESYLKLIRYKLMYIHSIAYILFDVVSALLLLQGMTTLYCSSSCLKNGKTVVCIAPPNTGKSLTVLKLQNHFGASTISEDMAITDGTYIWGATNTDLYRDYRGLGLNQTHNNPNVMSSHKIDLVYLLQKGSPDYETTDNEILDKILLINRYSLGYYYSPCVRVLDYYNRDISIRDAQEAEERIIRKIVSQSDACIVQRGNALEFSDFIRDSSENGGIKGK